MICRSRSSISKQKMKCCVHVFPRKRIFLKEDERSRLLKLGKELGPAIRHLITIVDYSTFRRWVRNDGRIVSEIRQR